jgi:hypothetical protein
MILAAIAIAATLPIRAEAQDRDLGNTWVIEPVADGEGEALVPKGDYLLKQRLLPTGLVELKADVELPGGKLASGSQLIEVRPSEARIFCWPRTAKLKLLGRTFQPCLVDGNGDGAFDSWFTAGTTTQGILSIVGTWPHKTRALPSAVPFVRVAPAAMRDRYFVAIEHATAFIDPSRHLLLTAYGREGESGSKDKVQRLSDGPSLGEGALPKDFEMLGARFTVLSASAEGLKVRISRTMPAQTFGVMTIITYH